MTSDAGGVSLFEHTADIGLDVRGRSLEELLWWAATGLAEVVSGSRPARPDEGGLPPVRVTVDLGGAPDPEALLVDWLNFLLYKFESEGLLPGGDERDLSVTKDAGDRFWGVSGWFHGRPLTARASGAHVKAATFHGLRIWYDDGGLHRARVILDV